MCTADSALTTALYCWRMHTTAFHETARVTTPVTLMTAEELLAYPMPNTRTELVRGRLIVREPPGMRHGECALRLGVALSNYLTRDRETRALAETRGRVLVGDSGFTLARNPDTVRGPDVAYVSRTRWSAPLPEGYGEFAPDLAVEIRSPNDRIGGVLGKVGDWLDAGTALVWVVDPARQLVTVYRADGSQAMLGAHDTLSGEDVLPGFALPVAELLAE